MKTCPKCSIDHDKPGVFCSRKCANGRRFSAESIAKKSASAKAFFDSLPASQRKLSIAHRQAVSIGMQRASQRRLMEQPWNGLPKPIKKQRVISEQQGRCNGCNLSEWRGRPMVFELEHKDGNRLNDDRENLEALCPNCHSQTPTWRGRKGAHKFVTDAQLVSAMREADGHIKPALASLSLNVGGDNFRRAKRLWMLVN